MASRNDPADINTAFLRYEVEVHTYGLNWWTQDPRADDVLAGDPGLVERLASRALAGEQIETKDVHCVPPPASWRPARRELHGDLVDDLIGSAPDPTAAPLALFLLGLPASGKSSVLKRIARGYLTERDGGRAITRDADEVRVRFPEYRDGRGSQILQQEVVDVTYGSVTNALPRNTHLLIDMVGDPRWLPREVEHFSRLGLTIVVLCSEISIEVAELRAKRRALTDGRYVSLAYLRSCADRPRLALQSALATSQVQHWAIIDTEARVPSVIDGDGHFGPAGGPPRYWSEDPLTGV